MASKGAFKQQNGSMKVLFSGIFFSKIICEEIFRYINGSSDFNGVVVVAVVVVDDAVVGLSWDVVKDIMKFLIDFALNTLFFCFSFSDYYFLR
jgi:hypothetical protein